MKIHSALLWGWLIACGISACIRPPQLVIPSTAALLTVVTWNMHAGRGDLQQLITDLETGGLDGGAPRDYLLLLQEFVDRGNDQRVRSPTRPLSLFVSPVRRGSGNAIVSTIALAEMRTIELPRERQPRAAAAATLVVNGERLFVVSAHLENRLGWLRGLFGDQARGRQATALLDALPTSGYGLVGGDLNTMFGPEEPAWRALLQRFPDTPERPEPTFRDRLVLDHLFVDLPDGWYVTRHVIREQYGSDHHPLAGEIRAKRLNAN